jgi:O-methyltransferase/methyltransferase family protein
MDAANELRRIINGYQVSQAVHVAATLNISDLLQERPRTGGELAQATGTHERSLSRLLRALTAVGLYTVDDEGRFANTELGAALCADAPHSPAGWAEFIGRPAYRLAWGALGHSVRTGENAFRSVHGMSVWEYRNLHPDELAVFDRAMTSQSQASADAVVAAYDFGGFTTLVDVGGGWGAMLAAILVRHPALRGVLFDQPTVVVGAEALLGRAGVADRCQVVGGDFFVSVPDGGDVYLLRDVVHDWGDEDSVRILRSCRRAVPATGRLLLVERLLDDGPHAATAAFSDLNMLVSPGGQERTVSEYSQLLERSGFCLDRSVNTDSPFVVMEGRPT